MKPLKVTDPHVLTRKMVGKMVADVADQVMQLNQRFDALHAQAVLGPVAQLVSAEAPASGGALQTPTASPALSAELRRPPVTVLPTYNGGGGRAAGQDMSSPVHTTMRRDHSATMAEVRAALILSRQAAALTETLHALYMRTPYTEMGGI